MPAPPKSPSGFQAFLRIAERGTPFPSVGGCASIAVPAHALACPPQHTASATHPFVRAVRTILHQLADAGGVRAIDLRVIDLFATQNLTPSPQPEAETELIPTPEIPPAFRILRHNSGLPIHSRRSQPTSLRARFTASWVPASPGQPPSTTLNNRRWGLLPARYR